MHFLWYTFILRLASSNDPLSVVTGLARHADSRLTVAVYTQLGLSELARAVEVLCRPRAGPRRGPQLVVHAVALPARSCS